MMRLTRIPFLIAAAALLTVTACAELQDPNNPNRNAQSGALVGAGLGAVLGAATGDDPEERRRRALAGAVIGGGAGAIGGAALDRQEAELRRQLGANVDIRNTGEQLIVTMPQDILFATDSAQLTGALRSDLVAVARSLQTYPNTTVNVIGHTDNTGEAAYNQALSERRANAVASVLISAGVSPARVRTIGRGENDPIATNLTPEGRQQNRRVEIVITPNA